jgi:hypothetical protein
MLSMAAATSSVVAPTEAVLATVSLFLFIGILTGY